MSVRYVCAMGCGSFAYTPGVYRCPTCGLRIRFREDRVIAAHEINDEIEAMS